MKKKKLKTSLKSLLDEENDIFEENTSEITLDDAAPENPGGNQEVNSPSDSDTLDRLLNRLDNFEAGDLVEGVDLLESIESILAQSSLEKSKTDILQRIRKVLEGIIRNDGGDRQKELDSLVGKLTDGKNSETASAGAGGESEKPVGEKNIKIELPPVPPEAVVSENIEVKVEDPDIMSSFILESKEHLTNIEEKILTFENDGDMELLNTIFRSVHTVKGTSAFLGLDSIKSLSHRLEFLLDEVRKETLTVDSGVIDVLLEGTDFLTVMINELSEKFHSSSGGVFSIPSYAREIAALENKINNIGEEKEKEEHSDSRKSKLITKELVDSFTAESAEHLEEAELLLLQLEKDKTKVENIDTIFRNIHTVKGNAGFLGFTSVERICMQMESTLDSLRKDERKINREVISVLLHSLDVITKIIASPNDFHVEAETVHKALGEILLEEGKIAKEDLEKALDIQEMKVGEILLTEGKISKEDLETALKKQAALEPQGVSGKAPTVERKDVRVDMVKIDKLFNLMGELITAEDIIIHNPEIEKLKNMERSINYLTKITREMQEITMSIRMIPLEGLFNRMRRLVRDLSKKVGKKVDLHISGQDTEMDKTVIEEIADPLVHIIRNSLDHGLENKKTRLKKGKTPVGTISLDAKYEGNEIWIIITDDGAGLNRDKILAKAVSSGIVESESTEMRDEDVWSLIFAPGFSTADAVTEVSGRGVGMDVVRSNIEKLRGKVAIKSEIDKGTEITLKIPLTLAIMDGVTIKVGNIVFALPIGDIREFHKASMSHVTVAESGKEVLKLRDTIIPIIKLSQIYDQKEGASKISEGILLVVEANDKKAAFLVDEIIGYHQIVVKALPEALHGLSSISGCSIMGNGEVNLIIDCGSLLNEVLV